jgi:hypothetical protein
MKKEITKKYGKLAAVTWRKLNNKKFVSKYNYISFRKFFYKKIYFIFTKLFYKEEINRGKLTQTFDKLKQFMKCLPSLDTLLKYVNKVDFTKSSSKNDIIFIKLLLEMINHFYKKYDYPLYKVIIRII